MNFTLKKPCPECPFLKGSSTNQTLPKIRLREITRELDEDDHSTFTCHKTLDYSYERPQDHKKEKQQHCAGAMIYLQKQGRANIAMRMAHFFGMMDINKLDMSADVIERGDLEDESI